MVTVLIVRILTNWKAKWKGKVARSLREREVKVRLEEKMGRYCGSI